MWQLQNSRLTQTKVQEIAIEYQDCVAKAPQCTGNTQTTTIPSTYVTSYFKNSTSTADAPTWCTTNITNDFGKGLSVNTAVCRLQFYIPDDIGPPVLFYYRLTNFYQNHRRYVKSLDQEQLAGSFRSNDSISKSDCDPLKVDENTGKAYYPCGLIANSLFNDTFNPPVALNAAGENAANTTYYMTNKGIAWNSDKELFKQTVYTADQVVPPVNWRVQYPEYSSSIPIPNIQEMEEFHVWMRTAGLPTFSKLALRNDTAVMASGRYQVDIYDCRFHCPNKGMPQRGFTNMISV